MKKLFDENDKYTEEANKLSMRVCSKLLPDINEMSERGYSLRDIEYVCQKAIMDICLSLILSQMK